MEYLGRMCVDKVTGLKGICVAELTNLYGGPEVFIQTLASDAVNSFTSHWMPTSRIIVLEEQPALRKED